MGGEIDMRGFKVIYKERVYNAVNMNWEFDWNKRPPEPDGKTGIETPDFLNVVIVNEDGEVQLIRDEAFMFQFIRATN